MALLADYTAGTITVSANGTAVTGTGTAWQTAQFQEGDWLIANGWVNVVASVDSNTSLTLAQPWRGGALSGAAYRLRYMSDGSRASAQARQLIDMLGGSGTLEGLAELVGSPDMIPMFTGPGSFTLVPRTELVQGIAYDVQVNTLADRDDYDAQPEGFVVLVSDVGDGRSAIYSRVGPPAGWTDPAYITGATGDAGPYTEITFGPVTTVSSSTPASADVVQVDEDTIRVDLSIPKGEDGSGTGDVIGPAGGVTDGHMAVFDGTTGKAIKSAGKAPFSGSYGDLDDKPTLGSVSAIDLPSVPGGRLLDDGGNWIDPPEGGGYDPNMALLALEMADLKGGRMGMVGGVADPFDDESGVDDGASSNYEHDAENHWFEPTYVFDFEGQTSTDGTGITANNYTVFDRSLAVPNGITVEQIRVYLSAAATIVVKIATELSTTSYTIVFEQSIAHPGGGWHTVAASPYTTPGSGTHRIGFYIAAGGPTTGLFSVERSYKAGNVTGANQTSFLTDTNGIIPIQLIYNITPENLILTSVAYPAATEPELGRLAVQLVEDDPITINDDVTAEISRDGGTSWSQATLALVSSLDSVKLYEDAAIDLSGQPSGDDVVWRVKTDNNVDVAVSGVVAQWR